MRIFLSILLASGAVFGIGSGIARLHHGGRHHREHMMARVAETCVDAARRLDARGADGAPDDVDEIFDGRGAPGHHGRRGHRGHRGHGPGDRPGYPGAPPQTVFVPYPVAFPAPPPGAVAGPLAAPPPGDATGPHAAPATAPAE